MNPLVEKMLNTTVSNDVETRFLEDLFEEECKCRLNHRDIPCSVKVVAIHTCACDGSSRFRCENGVIWFDSYTIRGGRCAACHAPASECWTIRPI